jgi:hypothetical protein
LPWRFQRGFVGRLGQTGVFQSEGEALMAPRCYCHCVRFYPDGTALEMNTAYEPRELARWLHTGRRWLTKGRYTLCCSPQTIAIRFSFPYRSGPRPYWGVIEGADMILEVSRHLREQKKGGRYHWLRLPKLR